MNQLVEGGGDGKSRFTLFASLSPKYQSVVNLVVITYLSQTTGSSEERVQKDLEALLDQYFSSTMTNEQRVKLSTLLR